MKKWIKAFRLRTLPLALSSIVTGTALLKGENINWSVFSLAILTTLFLQVLSNLANDYGDFVKGTDNENRLGPERSIQSGEITADSMKRAVVICSFLAFITGICLLGVSFEWKFSTSFLVLFVLGLAGIAAAIKYTVGKYALAYHALGDVFVFLFFGLVGVLGAKYLQVKLIEGSDLLLASSIGLWSVAVLNMNNMRDHINDKAQDKNTLVVKMGFQRAKVYQASIVCLAIAFAFIYSALDSTLIRFLPLLFVIPFMFHLKRVIQNKDEKELNKELKIVSLSTFGFSVLTLITSLF